jgi:LysM repeat protein
VSRATLARFVAPAAFLLAVTGVVLLVRSSLDSNKPVSGTTTVAVTTRTGTAPVTTRTAAPKRYYVIASGDTLDAIATKFATSVDALERLNPGIEPTTLRPGEQIRIR